MSKITEYPIERFKPIIQSIITHLEENLNKTDIIFEKLISQEERIEKLEQAKTIPVIKAKTKKPPKRRPANKKRVGNGVYNKRRKASSK